VYAEVAGKKLIKIRPAGKRSRRHGGCAGTKKVGGEV